MKKKTQYRSQSARMLSEREMKPTRSWNREGWILTAILIGGLALIAFTVCS